MFETEARSPMQHGRLNAALDRQYRFDGIVKSLGSHIEVLAGAGPLELTEGDGMTTIPGDTSTGSLPTRPRTPISRVSGRSDISTSTVGWFPSWFMTRSDVDLSCVLLWDSLGLSHRHRRTILAGFLLGGDLIASGLQIDFSPDRMLLPGQAAPIFDLDDKWLLFRLHDGPVENTELSSAGALIRLALSTPRSNVPDIKAAAGYRLPRPARPMV
jgi:hypothetical protein